MTEVDRRQNRRAKQGFQDGDMEEPDTRNVVTVPAKKQKEPIKSFDALAGISRDIGFEGFNTIPDRISVAETDEPSEDSDPALDEVISQMNFGGNAYETADHNKGKPGNDPAQEMDTMGTIAETDLQRKRREAMDLLADVESQVKSHEEQVSSCQEDAEMVRKIRAQRTTLETRGLDSALEKSRQAEALILKANPKAKDILDAEEKKAQENRETATKKNREASEERERLAREASDKEADAIAKSMAEEGEQTLHDAIAKAIATPGKAYTAPPVFIDRNAKVATPPDGNGDYKMVPLGVKGVMQYEVLSTKDAKNNPVLNGRDLRHHGPLHFDRHRSSWKGAELGVFSVPFNMETKKMYQKPSETSRRWTHEKGTFNAPNPFFAGQIAIIDCYNREEEATRRAVAREEAATRLADGVANAHTDPMAFVLEGAMGQANFEETFPVTDEQKRLQAVVVRYSPEERAEVLNPVIDRLRKWLIKDNPQSDHPNAKDREEEALRGMTDKNRSDITKELESWEGLSEEYNVGLVAYGFDPQDKHPLRLPDLRQNQRVVTSIRAQRGGEESFWNLTLHYPVIMNVEAKNLEVSAENPEGKGMVQCLAHSVCIPKFDDRMGYQVQNLGRLMRAVVLKGMREAEHQPAPVEAEDKPHRHYWRKDGTCHCGEQKPAGDAS
jgi:hypothetical protein